jgi:hypothetical protein
MYGPWSSIENIIKGKVLTSPKFGPWWVLWVFVCPWLVHAPKVLQLCSNQLVDWLCKSVWIVDPFVNCPSPHPWTPTCPSTLRVLQTKECTSTPYPFNIFTLNLQLSLSRSLGVCQWRSQKLRFMLHDLCLPTYVCWVVPIAYQYVGRVIIWF